MVICLERGAGLHMAQLMPYHSLSLASVKSRLVLPFWYRLTWVVPEKGPLNGCVCVCVCVCVYSSTYISRHLQLRSGLFCWCKVFLPACRCCRQTTHLGFGLRRKRWSSPRQWYLHCLRTVPARYRNENSYDTKTYVTPAIFSRDFIARQNRRVRLCICALRLSRKHTKPSWLITIFLLVV